MKRRKGVSILTVENPQKGILLANNILFKNIDKNTVLYLSGGSTPRDLYVKLASEKKLKPKALALIDERFVNLSDSASNQKMIAETGLSSSLEVPFYGILAAQNDDIKKTAERYEATVRRLLSESKKNVAIMGIGEDGHTAGLPPRRVRPFAKASEGQAKIKNQKYVEGISDFPGEFRERITLTFKALSQMDLLIILVFGSAKRNALRKMFEDGPIEEIPARFYLKPEIVDKTLLITDQKV